MDIFLLIGLLLGINAVFVAAEFATVSVRKVRIQQLAEEGNVLARRLLPSIRNSQTLYRYMAACQIGITATSLILGAFGEQRVADIVRAWLGQTSLQPALVASIAATGTLLCLTALQVVLAELVPKSVAMRFPEQIALGLSWLVAASMRLFSVFIDVLNASGRLILKRLQIPLHWERHVHSPEEIELLIIQGRDGGALEEEEHRRLRRVLRFGERRVREIMVPRTRIRALAASSPTSVVMRVIASSTYTRLPVFEDDLDHILGIVHAKDLAIALARDPEHISLDRMIRPIPSIPYGVPVDQVLSQMRRQRAQMAVVLDEYGGTAGLITMEDLVEEVLGEVQDEFDREAPTFQRISEREALVRGDCPLADLRDELGVDLEDEEVHTVGGLVMKLLGRAPRQGDHVSHEACTFDVEEARGTHVTRVRVTVEAGQE